MRAFVETPPDAEPITAGQAARWLRLDADVANLDDDTLDDLITAARQYCETYCDRAFAPQTWCAVRDTLENMVLPGGRINSITRFTVGGQNIDEAIYTLSRDGRVRLNPGQRWPDYQPRPDGVQIVYEVGDDPIPQDVVHAMRLLLAHFYENRVENVTAVSVEALPLGVDALLTRHRSMRL